MNSLIIYMVFSFLISIVFLGMFIAFENKEKNSLKIFFLILFFWPILLLMLTIYTVWDMFKNE